jgi:hypothetical protein
MYVRTYFCTEIYINECMYICLYLCMYRSIKLKTRPWGSVVLATQRLPPQKLALTSPTSYGRSVGILHSRSKATEFLVYVCMYVCMYARYANHTSSHTNSSVVSEVTCKNIDTTSQDKLDTEGSALRAYLNAETSFRNKTFMGVNYSDHESANS